MEFQSRPLGNVVPLPHPVLLTDCCDLVIDLDNAMTPTPITVSPEDSVIKDRTWDPVQAYSSFSLSEIGVHERSPSWDCSSLHRVSKLKSAARKSQLWMPQLLFLHLHPEKHTLMKAYTLTVS